MPYFTVCNCNLIIQTTSLLPIVIELIEAQNNIMLVQPAKEFLSNHSQTNAFGWMSLSAGKHCAATYGATGVCVCMIAYIVYA